MPITTSLVADARTNSILIGGDKNGRIRLRVLIAHLDTPLEDGGSTQVRYLRYADAEELAAKLQTHFTQQASAGAATGATSPDHVSIWADLQTNALVVSAPPEMMRSLMLIVDKLDIRRAQVLVEAIIVEVLADRVSELGVTWAVKGSGSNTPIGITNFPGAGTNLINLIDATQGDSVDEIAAAGIGEGITIGVGRIVDSGTSFAAILSALEADATTNIISTPSIVTTDNEEASINVGQEVPFVTGSFSNTGGAAGAVNPFQTIQREQIGVKLTITPQINEGNAILLKISQEISSISESAAASDIITNQRTIDTTVIVEDGAILVLGGLIEDSLRESTQKVPILGSIPLIGALFRNRSVDKVKTNLMVFIRPKILRDGTEAATATHAKYNYARDLLSQGGSSNPRVRDADRLTIPPLESYEEEAKAIDSADDSSD